MYGENMNPVVITEKTDDFSDINLNLEMSIEDIGAEIQRGHSMNKDEALKCAAIIKAQMEKQKFAGRTSTKNVVMIVTAALLLGCFLLKRK
jgi:hypothetical protein